jgi:hypothetical protein
MGKKTKKKCEICTCKCLYFPQEPYEVLEETIIDGVKHRKVVRRCLYDLSLINSWNKQCVREKGPCLPKSLTPMPPAFKNKKTPNTRGTKL